MEMIIDTKTKKNSGLPSAINVLGKDLDAMEEQQRVLLVDDDDEFLQLTKLILRQSGYDVASANAFDIAIEKCRTFQPDVVLLDLMMPQVDGWQTCEALRDMTDAPIIMVSANSNREAVVKSLELGADDYITKPFYNREVVARIQAVLRRAERSKSKTKQEKGYSFPEINLSIDLENQIIVLRDQVHYLMGREFSALTSLASRAPKVATYEDIQQEVWGTNSNNDHNAVKNIIFILRQKLEIDPSNPEIILNYRGIGYYLRTSIEHLNHK